MPGKSEPDKKSISLNSSWSYGTANVKGSNPRSFSKGGKKSGNSGGKKKPAMKGY